MLTTIQELEREIDQFHKNIKDSNELMKILMSVASLTKTQTESFEVRTRALHEELSKLPPELSDLFRKKIESFIQEIHREHQAYQSAVTSLMDRYSEKITAAEGAIAKVPGILDAQNEAAQKRHLEALERIETTYAQTLTSSMERLATQVSGATEAATKIPGVLEAKTEAAHKKYLADLGAVEEGHANKLNAIVEQHSSKLSAATDALAKVPAELELQMQKDRSENIAGLKQIQEQYALDLAKANEAFAKQLQAVVDAIQAVPGQINDNATQQYGAFLKELEKMMDARLAQLSATEKRVEDLSQQLEAKYNAFVSKLESTNMDQLYKYCQDMNKSINTKLGIALGGVAIAVIVSIVSLFI